MVAPQALTFNSDTTSQDVVVTALHDTVSDEGDEDFSLFLTGDTAVEFSIFTATVNITDASKLVEYDLLFMSVISLSSCCPGFQSALLYIY